MTDESEAQVVVGADGWRVHTARGRPSLLEVYREHATCAEDFVDLEMDEDGYLFVGVERPGDDWPSLVVTQRFSPSIGFTPGVLLVPATGCVFIGAGSRLLCYRFRESAWQRQWRDTTDLGFWSWRQHGDVVVMSAELELAAWTTDGDKLWTTFVEPPWSYSVTDGTVRLDVMGSLREFPLSAGP